MMLDLLALPTASAQDFTRVRVQIGRATGVDPALIERVEREFGLRFLVGYGQSKAPCLTMSTMVIRLTSGRGQADIPCPVEK